MRFIVLFTFTFLHAFKAITQINDAGVVLHRIPTNVNYNNSNAKTSGFSSTGSNLDVVFHRLNFTANPDDATKTLIGDVTTYFKTTEPNVISLSFDFNKNSFNNTDLIVKYHGVNCVVNFPSTGNINVLQISLPTPILFTGTLDSINIIYKGIPPAELGAATGYQREVDNVGNNYIYTLSESYEDRDWWPCKADMQDKIDSLDINVTVPNIFWVASNGLMEDSSIVGANRVFKFKHRYPIASYLVSLGIAKYKKIYLGNLVSGSKTVPFIVNYFPDKSPTTENNILNFLNNHKLVFEALSNLFGTYPFNDEKHGFYEFGFSGGMEHQTFSGLSNSAFQANSIMTHELAHQWWGDKVTFSTWTHLWLAEGFATYSEALAYEFVPSIGISEVTKMANIKTSACNNTSTPILISNIASSNTIWTTNNTTAVYNRGCMVASMLRTLLGDSKFFTACKNYLLNNSLAYKSATTNDLQIAMEQQFGDTLTGFFNEWMNKKGTPNYNIQWGKNNNKINLQCNQTVNSSGANFTAATFFPMPIIIKIADTINGLDTTVIIYHQSPNKFQLGGNGLGTIVNGNVVSYILSFVPNKVIFDPSNKTMASASITFSALLPLQKINAQIVQSNTIEANILTNSLIDKVDIQSRESNNSFNTVATMQLVSNQKYIYKIPQQTTPKTVFRVIANTSNGLMYSEEILYNNSKPKTSITVYPNPAKNSIYVNSTTKYDKLQVKDIAGKLLLQNTIYTNKMVNIESLKRGTYIVEIFKEKVLLGISTFIKE